METRDAISQRRSIKQFDPNHVMEKSLQQQLLSLAMLAPTSFNIQHWRFVVISDVEQRQRLCEAAWGQTQITEASLLVVICADVQAWQKQPARYWREAEAPNRERILSTMEAFYAGRTQLQHDEALRSVGIAAQTLMLAAKEMGYDSSPMVGFDFDKVAELINLPQDHLVGMMVAIGKAAVAPWPRSGQLPYEQVVIENRFA